MLQIGEAFSGSESSSLRDAMQRQSGRFFQAFHAANLQVPCLQLCMSCPRLTLTMVHIRSCSQHRLPVATASMMHVWDAEAKGELVDRRSLLMPTVKELLRELLCLYQVI